MSFSYYDILGIAPSATNDEIKTAYRSAVLKYHPDVNTAPNAAQLTQIINEAYSTLVDPEKRHTYDQSIGTGARLDDAAASEQPWVLYVCDGCGAISPHLRFAMFFYVFSIFLFTHAQPSGGVLCPLCRSARAWRSALFSGLLGPWNVFFWWSGYYTLRALLAAVRGGEQPAQPNSALLRHQSIAFLQRGYIAESKTALADSLRFEPRYSSDGSGPAAATLSLLKESVFNGISTINGPRWLKGQSAALLFSVVAPILYLLVLTWMGSPSSDPPGPAALSRAAQTRLGSAQATRQQGFHNDPLISLMQKCAAGDKTQSAAAAGYSACSLAIARLRDPQLVSTTTEQHQGRSLFVAIAQAYEALAAVRLGHREEAIGLTAQAASAFKNLRDNGATATIRNNAEAWYNCLDHFACGAPPP